MLKNIQVSRHLFGIQIYDEIVKLVLVKNICII